MTIKTDTKPGKAMAAALVKGDQKAIESAWNGTMDAIAARVRDDFEASRQGADREVLAGRGYRQLTSAEERFYSNLRQAARTSNPKQAFLDLVGDGKDEDLMPSTIVEDVFKNLVEEHKLLQVIKFQYTGYMTKWIRNKHTAAKAAWGAITDEIKKEITSDLEVIDIDNNKLSAFCVIPLDILDMGYQFIDSYVRAVLAEAIYSGLEDGIINGSGVGNTPVGLKRSIKDGVSVNTSTGYPAKTAVKLTELDVKSYCDVIATMAKTERGLTREVPGVYMIVSPVDYLKRIVPATTVLTQVGYVGNLFPYPTEVIQSSQVAEGEAILLVPDTYTFCVGGSRNGNIEFDDSVGFLDDTRTFKVVQHGDGIADDDTCAVLLDISELETLYPTVKTIDVPSV